VNLRPDGLWSYRYITRFRAQELSGVEVQIFGVKKSAETRAALRFFAERRIKVHFVDLLERAASRGELTRFAQKFGVQALLDKDSRRFAELGLAVASRSDERWLELMTQEPLLLRMPLVRNQNQLTVGAAEAAWREWTGK
jgi:arsenate reductase (glutaredoxin)